jgi:hypothetical protein
MTVPTDLQNCAGWYICDAAHYDSGLNQFVDQSGLGFHLGRLSGTPPSFITRGGISCIDLTNNFFYEIDNPIPVLGSIMFKIHSDATGAPTGSLAMFDWRNSLFNNDDHAALAPRGPWEAFDARKVFFFATGPYIRVTSFIGSDPLANSDFVPANTWTVCTTVNNFELSEAKARLGNGATVIDNAPLSNNVPPQYQEDTMRFAYLKETGGLTPPQHLSIAQFAFWHDDILLNQSELAESLANSWA